MDDILLIDKPKGITSFDVIRILRRKTGIKKMGHAGTLDPLASGLMIIGVQKGTKKLNEYIKLDKVYRTEVLLGIKTDSGDLEGNVVEEKKVEDIDEEKLRNILKIMEGDIELCVPIYSAIKRKGEALYKKARRGEVVVPPKKVMHIYWMKYLGIKKAEKGTIIELDIKVSSGTYIRSIAEEIGNRLNYPATVQELRRISIGDLKIEDAVILDSM